MEGFPPLTNEQSNGNIILWQTEQYVDKKSCSRFHVLFEWEQRAGTTKRHYFPNCQVDKITCADAHIHNTHKRCVIYQMSKILIQKMVAFRLTGQHHSPATALCASNEPCSVCLAHLFFCIFFVMPCVYTKRVILRPSPEMTMNEGATEPQNFVIQGMNSK